MPSNKDDRSDLKLGWHFLPADKKLEYGDGRRAEVGKTLSCTGVSNPRCCYYGMHASPQIAEAARFNKGPVLTRVEVWGDVHSEGNKFAGRHRKVLWMGTLTAKDLKACLAAVGAPSSAAEVDDLITDLANAAANSRYKGKIETWLKNWAAKNGCIDGAYVSHPEKFVYTKPQIDVKTLKSLLNDRFVKSESELKKDVGDAFDLSAWGAAIDDLSCENDVLEVSDYQQKSTYDWENGYLLQRKYKRSGGKRKK